jgi:hypothetical protein
MFPHELQKLEFHLEGLMGLLVRHTVGGEELHRDKRVGLLASIQINTKSF